MIQTQVQRVQTPQMIHLAPKRSMGVMVAHYRYMLEE